MSTFKSVIAIVVPVLLAIAIFQNTDPARIHFLFWSFTIPQIVLITVTALLGITFGYLIASYQQIRRRKKKDIKAQQGGST
jgi:uncharacterized integral membrane protein